MRRMAWLAESVPSFCRFVAAVFMLCLSHAPSFSQKVVAGYYPSWLRMTLPATKVQFENLTHVVHAFAWPEGSGKVSMYGDLLYPELVTATHSAGKKILIALGGWGQSSGFSPMAAEVSTRQTFIDNVIKFCDEHGYDGIDIDWEYPATAADRENLNHLVRQLRRAFLERGRSWLLTMAVPASHRSGQWFDCDSLRQYVDWFGCMTYDFMGSWVSIATHNSALYPHASWTTGSVHEGVEYLLLTRAVPPAQVLLGIPFYGRGCNATGLFQPNTGGNTEYYYSQVQPKIGNGWDYFWDDTSKVPYLMNTTRTKFISFDDTTSVRLKCEYSKRKGLAGVMIWALGQDLVANNQPLLQTVGRSTGLATHVEDFGSKTSPTVLLLGHYPNPGNEHITMAFRLTKQDHVTLEVFNTRGEKAATLLDAHRAPGYHEIRFPAKDLPSGVYIYRLQGSHFSKSGKVTILK